MGCIYNGVCSSLVALFLWQQWYFTHYICEFIKIGFVFEFVVGLCNLREIIVYNMVIHLVGSMTILNVLLNTIGGISCF